MMKLKEPDPITLERHLSIKTVVSIVFTLILVFSLTVNSWIIINLYTEKFVEQAVKLNLNYASQLSYNIGNTVMNYEADIKVISKMAVISYLLDLDRPADEDDQALYFDAVDVLVKYNQSMYIYLSNISLYTISGNSFQYGNFNYLVQDIFNSDYYIKGMQYPANLCWLGYNPINGKYEAVKILYDNDYVVTGIILMMFNTNYFRNYISISNYTDLSNIYVVNENNKIQYAENVNMIGTDMDAALTSQMVSAEGHFSFEDNSVLYKKVKEPKLIVFIPDWKIIIISENEYFTREANSMLVSLIIIMSFIMILGTLVMIYVAGRITRPINELTASMHKLITNSSFMIKANEKQSFSREVNYLIKSYNYLISEINRLIDNVVAERNKKKNLAQKILEEQVAPHFLYNTLQIISLQAFEAGADDVCKTISNLSFLLTERLNHRNSLISISQEMKYIDVYVAIIKVKYEDKINFHIEIDESVVDYLIPPFILQPLVENAVTHGVVPKVGNGNINIKVLQLDGIITFTIEDDGVGMNMCKVNELTSICENDDLLLSEDHDHIGIINIYQRLKLIYNDGFLFDLTSKLFFGTKIQIKLPILQHEKKNQIEIGEESNEV